MTQPSALTESVVERLADEMAGRWQRGERPVAEEFLDRAPDLWHRPDAALELIAEELALREEYGLPATAAELAARFPRWKAQVLALLECHQVLGPRVVAPQFPEPGDDFGDFRLVSELGRGAHGRVYLAAQASLAGRPVVLKLGPTTGGEHLSLARLQHSHIVPLYSAHEFPDRGLRALCLPYFGGETLAALVAKLGSRPGPVAGRDLLAALGRGPEAPAPAHGPARGFLEQASLADAICWIGACLADALQYAHDRGLLHLDLKPSNVLLAADGVPMLLDFHLTRPPLAAGEPPPLWLGGTPGYMAPEQAAAMQAVRTGGQVPAAVDARADVYALGVLLAELVRGLGRSAVPVGLRDILTRCTAPAAVDRYQSAAGVAADLRRQLADLPLKGVGNRSLLERWGKWRRRRPHALPLALALAALVTIIGGLVIRADRQADDARRALVRGEGRLSEGKYEEAVGDFRRGMALVEGVPFQRELLARLRDARHIAERGHAAADRAKVAAELHQFCDKVRPLYGAEVLAPDQVPAVLVLLRKTWEQRGEFAAKLEGQATPDLEERWRADLLDVGILAADLGVRAAPRGDVPAAQRRALSILNEAEALLGPRRVLFLERARHARSLGEQAVAEAAGRQAAETPPRRAWELFVSGRSLFAAGDLKAAAEELAKCLADEPASVWGNYYFGVCRLKQNEPIEAVAAFAAAYAAAPTSAWCVYNRGLAYTEAGRPEAAVADFDRALTLDPGLSPAYLGRAIAHRRAGHEAAAQADLRRAKAAGLTTGK